MRRWKLWLGLAIVIIAAGSGGAYYYLKPDQTAAAQEAASVTVQATRSNLELKISATGSVVADSRETVTAGVSGTIEALNVKVGDKVKAGQVLATFEPEKDYEKEISNLQTSMESKQLQMEDYETQYKEATGTENEEETKRKLTNSIESLKLEIQQAEEDLSDLYEEQADVPQVIATIDGEITASDVKVGDEVSPNTVIAEIVNYELLEFVVSVDELDIPSVKEGQTTQIYLNALPDQTFEGTVSSISREGTASGGVSAYEVSLLMKDIAGVKVGMSGEADIVLESRENVVVVPVDAVVEMGNRTFVRVPGNGGSQADATEAGGERPAGEAPTGESPTGETPTGEAPSRDGAAAAGSEETNQEAGEGQRQMPNFPQRQGAQGGSIQGAAGRGAAMEAAAGMEGEMVPVETGISNETYVEIISGLEEGDEVLVPVPQGAAGMGSSEEEEVQMMPGVMFPAGGGMGGFEGAGSGAGGGFVRGSGMGGGGR